MRVIAILLLISLLSTAQEKVKPTTAIPDGLVPIQPINDTHFAFLCAKTNKLASDSDIKAALAKAFDLTNISQIIRFSSDPDQGTLNWTIGRARFVATLSDLPLPQGDIQYASNNSIHWPTAYKQLAKHTSHFTITCTSRYPRPWMTSLALSKAVVALSQTHDSVGVYWGDASIVHPIESFAKLASRPLKPNIKNIPVDLWVGILIENHQDGSTSVYTDGMKVLGFKEFEIHRSPLSNARLYDILSKTINLALNENLHLKNGANLKLSENTILKAEFGKSSIGRSQSVIILRPAR